MHDVPGPRRPRASVRVHHLRHLRVHHVFGGAPRVSVSRQVHQQLALHARGGQDDAGRRKRRRARQVPRGVVRHPPRALVLPGGEHQEGTPQKLHPAGVPREEVRRRRCAPRPSTSTSPSLRRASERSVRSLHTDDAARARAGGHPRARERRPVWTRRVRFAAQGAGDNTRRSASVADAAGATAPATTAAHR